MITLFFVVVQVFLPVVTVTFICGLFINRIDNTVPDSWKHFKFDFMKFPWLEKEFAFFDALTVRNVSIFVPQEDAEIYFFLTDVTTALIPARCRVFVIRKRLEVEPAISPKLRELDNLAKEHYGSVVDTIGIVELQTLRKVFGVNKWSIFMGQRFWVEKNCNGYVILIGGGLKTAELFGRISQEFLAKDG